MKKDEYDSIVVGAGPAGCSAAKVMAKNKLNVLLLEKAPVVGSPLCCAEAVSLFFFSQHFDLNPKWISNLIHKVVLVSPESTRFNLFHPDCAVVLERKIFDKDLAISASSEGAEVNVNACVVGILKDKKNKVYGVKVKEDGKEIEYKAKVIICADGIESKTAKFAGVDTTLELNQVSSCAQYLLAGIEIVPDCVEFWVGKKLAPGGYAWIFPKGKDCANVGLGITPNLADGKKAKDFLDSFILKRFSKYSKLEMMSGGVPFFSRKSILVKDNLLLVGDAARLADPLSGAGIANAILSGKIAGEVTSEFIKKNHPQKYLKEYEKKFMGKRGRYLRFFSFCRKVFLKMSDSDYDSIVLFLKDYFGSKKVEKIDIIGLVKVILKQNPFLLRILKKVIW